MIHCPSMESTRPAVLVTSLIVLGIAALAAPRVLGCDRNTPVDFLSRPAARLEIPPESLVAADFDGDDVQDLVTAGGRGYSVHLGNGDGTFREVSLFRRLGFTDIIAADLDEDELPDLAGATGRTGILVMLGDGNGTFPGVTLLRIGPAAESIVAADFNDDELIDLATINSDNTIAVLLGEDLGVFGPATPFEVDAPRAPPFSSLVAADFDDDGIPDLATVNTASGDVSVLLGDGDGGFEPSDLFGQGGDGRPAIVAARLNDDDFLDISVTHALTGDGQVLLGDGVGSFSDAKRFRAGDDVSDLVAADLNVDGFIDLATANSRGVFVFPGDGDGSFGEPQTLPLRGGASSIVVADFDDDGLVDLAAASSLASTFTVFLNRIVSDTADCNGNDLPDICDIATGRSTDADDNGRPDECEGGAQIPGDCNQDGGLSLTDGVCLLGNAAGLPCGEATVEDPANRALLDSNGDGSVNLSDAVAVFAFLFASGLAPELGTECVSIRGCPPVCR